jgi:hypothetical protein
MGAKRSKTCQIRIPFVKNRIELGERYACPVNLDSQIEWKCDHPFAVQFDWDAPFEVLSKGKNSLTMRFKTGACLKPLHSYRYMIAVYANGSVVTSVGIIIVIPPGGGKPPIPKQCKMTQIPGIIIVIPPGGGKPPNPKQ